jgi:hypothetical protein
MAVHAERLKTRHAAFIRVLHGEIRRHPGGYSEIARITGRPPQSLINMFNPIAIDQAPTAELLLDVLAIVQAREAVGLIAAEVGCSLKDEVLPEMESDVSGWRQAVAEMGEALACGSQALADGRFDAAERVAVSKELGDVIRAASALKRKLSGAR